MRKRMIFVLILSLLFACQKKTETTKTDVQQAKLPRVVVSQVKKENVSESVQVYGQTKPFKAIDVFSKVNGLVLKKFHELGQTVKKGDVLAVVRQDIPGMEFADHEVKANMDGLILQDFVEPGATVTVQKPLFRLAQMNPVLIEVKIPEEWQPSLNLKQPVSVQFRALPGQKFKAAVYRVLPQQDVQTHSLVVQLTLPNPQLKLKTNMFVTAQFKFAERQALTIPVDALVRTGLEYFVFTVENGVAHKQLVQVGQVFDNHIEVKQGLRQGQSVVVFGQNLLDEGVKVEAKEQQ